MRRAEYAVYSIVLTFTDNDPINAGAYKATGDPAIMKEYRKQTDRLLRALLQSLRRHKKTKKGAGWESMIKAIASCHKVRNGIAEPDRLHIHLMLVGTHGATMYKFIRDYWQKRHNAIVLLPKKVDPNWFEKYLDQQEFISKIANI